MASLGNSELQQRFNGSTFYSTLSLMGIPGEMPISRLFHSHNGFSQILPDSSKIAIDRNPQLPFYGSHGNPVIISLLISEHSPGRRT
jgi:hypothetical protein